MGGKVWLSFFWILGSFVKISLFCIRIDAGRGYQKQNSSTVGVERVKCKAPGLAWGGLSRLCSADDWELSGIVRQLVALGAGCLFEVGI